MGRGLSGQQRRVLESAYSNAPRRAERQAEADARGRSAHRYIAAVAASNGQSAQDPYVPYPVPDLTHGDVLLAFYGWRCGKMRRTWRERIDGIRTNTLRVYKNYGRSDEVGTISRSAYEVTHASVARTVTRLFRRGLLEYRQGGGYYLTDAGLALCAELFDGGEPAGGEPALHREHANAAG